VGIGDSSVALNMIMKAPVWFVITILIWWLEIPDTTAPCSLINWLDISSDWWLVGQPPVHWEMICGTHPMPFVQKTILEVCWRLYFSLP